MKLAALIACSLPLTLHAASDTIVVGAKNFTESSVLAELMAQVIEAHTDLDVERRINLGGTMICFGALRAGEIDLYAEYTGTGWAVLLKEQETVTDPLRAFLHVRREFSREYNLRWLDPFGLNNTYALAMDASKAEELGISRISDLLPHQADLRAGFSIEFGSREDGYPGLVRAYGLDLGTVRNLEHGLAYRAIQSGSIDLIDAYSTDGKLLRFDLRVLEDDRSFFPPYQAAPLVREAVLDAHPEIELALGRLAFRLTDRSAQALNFLVETEGQGTPAVTRAFLEWAGLVEGEEPSASASRASLERLLGRGQAARLSPAETPHTTRITGRLQHTAGLVLEHLTLTLSAVLLAAAFAIPLGIAITTRPRLRRLSLGAASILQTVPSLALLAFMIPILGLDARAAVAALFLYALLPILRNTYTGIIEVDTNLTEAARGLGLTPRQVLTRIELPLARRTILAGIRTATVITIGVATLAAFIGAGGLGEPIVEGLYLDDTKLILSGALPAALLALLTDRALAFLERRLDPRRIRNG